MNSKELQSILFFCMENYDDWRNMKIMFHKKLENEMVMEIEVEEFFADGELKKILLFGDIGEQKITLENIDFLLHVLQEIDPKEWMSFNVFCKLQKDSIEEVEIKIAVVDEEENILILNL